MEETEKKNQEKETKKNSWRKVILALGAVGFIVALIKGGLWFHYRLTHATTNDAFVEADMINVSPLVSGHIAQILVDEAQEVKKGQLLFILDDRDYRARLQVAQAALKEAQKMAQAREASLEKAQKALVLTEKEVTQSIALAKAQMDASLARLQQVKRDYNRYKALYKRRVIGKQKFETMETALKEAREAFKARKAAYLQALAQREKVALARAQVEEAKKALEAARATEKKAQEALKAAQITLEHTRVKSPVDGVVAKKFLYPGDFVAPGYPVLSLYDRSTLYVNANLEETKARGVRLGAPVDIWVDAYPGIKLKGKVIKIGEASAAKFALIPRDVTAGEFTKVVQRIPIKIQLVDTRGKRLVPGMSVEVGIKTK